MDFDSLDDVDNFDVLVVSLTEVSENISKINPIKQNN
jgi:hypothetical protein